MRLAAPSLLRDLPELTPQELYERHQLVTQPDPALIRACKEPLLSLGTLEHSAWEKPDNYGSVLLRLGVCATQRVLFRHRRTVYATRTHGCRYKEEPSNWFEPLDLAGFTALAPRPRPTCSRLRLAFDTARHNRMGWLRCAGGQYLEYSDAQALHAAFMELPDECRCFRVAADLEQQGPGLSRQDFLLRTHPGPTFGFFE